MRKIILASGSPRRKELLQILGLQFDLEESNYKEELEKKRNPKELACFLSQNKAKAVAQKHKDAIVIAADTLIVFQGKILGKPRSREDAQEMLRRISNKSHSVITGFTIIDTRKNKTISQTVETKVYFRKLSEKEIENYVKTGEPQDKAGAYGIQGLGQILIQRIEGDYANVVGLPLGALAQSLKEFKINVI